MTAQARRIDETRLRRALSRVLAPALAAKVVDEATIADDEPVPTELSQRVICGWWKRLGHQAPKGRLSQPRAS